MRIVRCSDCRGSVCTCRGCTCLEWGCTCLEWGDLPGVYLPGVGGIPARGCTRPSGFVYLPEGELCTCQGVYLLGRHLPGGCTYLGMCTCQVGLYLLRGCTCWEGTCLDGVPAWECVPARWDCTRPGGVPARWDCTCPGGVPAHGGVCQHALRQTHRVRTEWLTDACENITLPQLRKNQLRIQNFPEEGAPTPGECQHMILPNLVKNCMKVKEFGPPGGCIPRDPFRSATGNGLWGRSNQENTRPAALFIML